MITALLLVVISGCGNGANEKTVRIGYFPNVTHAPALIGFGENRFAQEFGEEVKLEEKVFVAGPALMEALIAGEIDIAYIGPIPAINGFVKGADISIISGVNNAGAVLIAREGSGAYSVKDLAGKKVAVPQYANTQDISLRHLLKEVGLIDKSKGGTVEILQVAPADMNLLFSKNQIDAALVPEPWGTQLTAETESYILLNWNEIWNEGNYPTTVIITRNEFLKENPEMITRWLKIHGEIIKYINEEPGKAILTIDDQLTKLTGKELPRSYIKGSLGKCKFTMELDPKTLDEFAELSYESGYLKSVPDLRPLIRNLDN